jgi:hypothetical protein
LDRIVPPIEIQGRVSFAYAKETFSKTIIIKYRQIIYAGIERNSLFGFVCEDPSTISPQIRVAFQEIELRDCLWFEAISQFCNEPPSLTEISL